MKKLKEVLVFLLKAVVIQAFREYLVEMNAQGKDPLELKLKAVVIQAFREYLVEMNAQGKDPLELKPILERLVYDVIF